MKQKKKNQNEKKEAERKIIKNRIIRDIKTLFEQEWEEDYYEHKRLNSFWSNHYIEYERNVVKSRNLSFNKYLNKVKPYVSNITIDLQNYNAWKTQLIITINFSSPKDAEEEHVIQSMINYTL